MLIFVVQKLVVQIFYRTVPTVLIDFNSIIRPLQILACECIDIIIFCFIANLQKIAMFIP